MGIDCSAQFVKLASKGHNVEMQRITKQALNNFGNDLHCLFLTIFTPFIQMIKSGYYHVVSARRYIRKSWRVKEDQIYVLIADGDIKSCYLVDL